MVALPGVLKAGARMPLDAAYPSERIAFILEDAGVQLLLTGADLIPLLSSTPTTIVG